MKRLALSLSLVAALPVGSAFAQSRPFSPALPCAALRQLVLTRGAVVLSTSPTTYERFVRDSGFCVLSEYTRSAYVPAADTPQCFVGYTCRSGPRELFDF